MMAGQEQPVQAKVSGKAAKGGQSPLLFISNLIYSSSNIIGIDIGSSYIKILQLQKSGNRYSVRNCVTRGLSQQARDNPEEKKRAAQEYLRKFISEARIKTNLARIAVSGKGVFIFSLTVPQMNKKDLRGAVGIELKKRLPSLLDINSVSFDFFVTGTLGDEKTAPLLVTCVAAEKQAVEEQVQLVKELDLRPVAVYTIPDCLGSLLPLCFDTAPKGTTVLLDIGASVSGLNFYKGHNLIFSREIPIGGDHFTAAMSRNLSAPGGATAAAAVSAEDAEKLKRNWGIPLDEEAKTGFLTDFGEFRGEQINMMLRPVLERLVMEVSRTIQYYVKTFRSERVTELYLTGGTSRMKNLDKFLRENVEGIQKVQPLNILKSVKGWSERLHSQEMVMEQAAPHLAVSFGLCLGAGGKVNLLPMKEKLEQKANLLSMLLRFAFPAVLLLNLLLYTLVYFNGLKYQMLVSRLGSDMYRLEPAAAKVREYQGRISGIDQKKRLLEQARGRQPYWLGLMRELSVIIPDTIVVSRISTEEDRKPMRLRLEGRIYPPQYTVADLALSQFVLTLEESPYFLHVELVNSSKDVYSSAPSADFEILCTLNY